MQHRRMIPKARHLRARHLHHSREPDRLRGWLVAACAAVIVGGSAVRAAEEVASHRDALAAIRSAESAFAQASRRCGVRCAFLEFAAPDAIVFRPGPTNAIEAYSKDADQPDLQLDWWPAFLGVARSGDLGVSLGPWELHRRSTGKAGFGYFITIWKQQPDGRWKFALDSAGTRLARAPARRREGALIEPAVMNGDDGASGEAHALALDTKLNAGIEQTGPDAARPWLTADTWVMGSGAEPAPGLEAALRELASRPATSRYARQGSGGSRGGDLVYTFGTVRGVPNDKGAFSGRYLRVWQLRGDRWHLLIDSVSRD